MFSNEKSIDIDQVDCSDETYRISSKKDLAPLLQSIKANHLIRPCLLRTQPGENSKTRYIIISGHRRVAALKRLKLEKIPAKIAIDNEIGKGLDLFLAKTAIIENAFARELDLIEKAKGVLLLTHFLNLEDICKTSTSIFNLDLNFKAVEQLFKIGSMNSFVHDLILSKKLSFKNAIRLNSFDNKVMERFLYIFNKINTSQNKQAEIITYFNEIALRENILLPDLLQSNKVNQILEDDNPDKNLKGNLLREYLKKRRYPEMTKAFDIHAAKLKELNLDPRIKLKPPQNFEGDKYSVYFEFQSIHEFQKHIRNLSSVSKAASLKDILK